MASPYYRCPNCHNVSRKNDNTFEMVEASGSGTLFVAPGGVPCPDCGANHSFDDIYLHPKYDVPIEDVYGGKAGVDLQLIRRAHAAGRIRLSEQELALLKANLPAAAAASPSKANASSTASVQRLSEQEKVRLQPMLRSSSAKSTSSRTQKKEIGCGPGSIGILFLIAAAVSVYLEQQGAGCGYGTAAALAGLGLIGLIASAQSLVGGSGITRSAVQTPSTIKPTHDGKPVDTRANIAQDMRQLAEKHEGDAPLIRILADSLITGRTQGGEHVNPGEIPQLLNQLAAMQRDHGQNQLASDMESLAQRIKRIE